MLTWNSEPTGTGCATATVVQIKIVIVEKMSGREKHRKRTEPPSRQNPAGTAY